MEQRDINSLADAWIAYWQAPERSVERERHVWAIGLGHEMVHDDPESLWLLILEVHRGDKSIAIQQVLSAGPIEDLLAILRDDVFIPYDGSRLVPVDRLKVGRQGSMSYVKLEDGTILIPQKNYEAIKKQFDQGESR